MQPDEKERLLKYLTDVVITAKELNNFRDQKLEAYLIKRNRWFVERGLEIISEALKKAISIQSELPISNLPQIFGMRNRLAHEYDKIEISNLFVIIQKSIPILLNEVEAIIINLEED